MERIADLEAEHPPGTVAGREPRAVKQLTDLYKALHGNEPVVGEGQRTI